MTQSFEDYYQDALDNKMSNSDFITEHSGTSLHFRKLLDSTRSVEEKEAILKDRYLQKQQNITGFTETSSRFVDADSGYRSDGKGGEIPFRLASGSNNYLDATDLMNQKGKSTLSSTIQARQVADLVGKPEEELTDQDYLNVKNYQLGEHLKQYVDENYKFSPYDRTKTYSPVENTQVPMAYRVVGYDRNPDGTVRRELIEAINPISGRNVSFDMSNNPYLNSRNNPEGFSIFDSIDSRENRDKLQGYEKEVASRTKINFGDALDIDSYPSELVDRVQSAVLQSTGRTLQYLPSAIVDTDYWKAVANGLTGQATADAITGVKQSTREDSQRNMLAANKAWDDGRPLDAILTWAKEVPGVLADSSVSMGLNLAGGAIAAPFTGGGSMAASTANAIRTFSGAFLMSADLTLAQIEQYKANNDGQSPNANTVAAMFAGQLALAVPEAWLMQTGLLDALPKSVSSIFDKTYRSNAVPTAIKQIGRATIGEGLQETFQESFDTWGSQKGGFSGDRSYFDIVQDEGIKAGIIGAMTGGALSGTAQSLSLPFKVNTEIRNNKEAAKVREQLDTYTNVGTKADTDASSALIDKINQIDVSTFSSTQDVVKAITSLSVLAQDSTKSMTANNAAKAKAQELIRHFITTNNDTDMDAFLKALGKTKEEVFEEQLAFSSLNARKVFLDTNKRLSEKAVKTEEANQLEIAKKLGIKEDTAKAQIENIQKSFQQVESEVRYGPSGYINYIDQYEAATKELEALPQDELTDEQKTRKAELEETQRAYVNALGRLYVNQVSKLGTFIDGAKEVLNPDNPNKNLTLQFLSGTTFDLVGSHLSNHSYESGYGVHKIVANTAKDVERMSKVIQKLPPALKKFLAEQYRFDFDQDVSNLEQAFKDVAAKISQKVTTTPEVQGKPSTIQKIVSKVTGKPVDTSMSNKDVIRSLPRIISNQSDKTLLQAKIRNLSTEQIESVRNDISNSKINEKQKKEFLATLDDIVKLEKDTQSAISDLNKRTESILNDAKKTVDSLTDDLINSISDTKEVSKLRKQVSKALADLQTLPETTEEVSALKKQLLDSNSKLIQKSNKLEAEKKPYLYVKRDKINAPARFTSKGILLADDITKDDLAITKQFITLLSKVGIDYNTLVSSLKTQDEIERFIYLHELRHKQQADTRKSFASFMAEYKKTPGRFEYDAVIYTLWKMKLITEVQYKAAYAYTKKLIKQSGIQGNKPIGTKESSLQIYSEEDTKTVSNTTENTETTSNTNTTEDVEVNETLEVLNENAEVTTDVVPEDKPVIEDTTKVIKSYLAVDIDANVDTGNTYSIFNGDMIDGKPYQFDISKEIRIGEPTSLLGGIEVDTSNSVIKDIITMFNKLKPRIVSLGQLTNSSFSRLEESPYLRLLYDIIIHNDGSNIHNPKSKVSLILRNNVAVAIVLGFNEYFRFNNVHKLFNPFTDEEVGRVFGISEQKMTTALAKKLKEITYQHGIPRAFLNNEIGKVILENLGIKPNKGTLYFYDRLAAGLGSVALDYAHANGWLNLSNYEIGKNSVLYKENRASHTLPMVSLNTNPNTFKTMYEDLAFLKNDSTETSTRGPLTKIKKALNTVVKNTNGLINIPSFAQGVMTKMLGTPYVINSSIVSRISADEATKRNVLLRMGWMPPEDILKLPYEQQDGQKGKNLNIEDQYDSLIEYANKNNPRYYFDYFFSSNGRVFLKSSSVNPQTQKTLQRFAVLPEAVYQEFDPSNAEDIDAMNFAIAQAFDAVKSEEVIANIGQAVAHYDNIEGMINDLISLDTKAFVKTYKHLGIEGIENFGQALNVLEHILLYQQNVGKGTKFKTWLAVENDSTTSGYAIRFLQFPRNTPEWRQWAKKVGIDLTDTKGTEIHGLKQIKGFNDIYKTMAAATAKLLPNLDVDRVDMASKKAIEYKQREIAKLKKDIRTIIEQSQSNKTNVTMVNRLYKIKLAKEEQIKKVELEIEGIIKRAKATNSEYEKSMLVHYSGFDNRDAVVLTKLFTLLVDALPKPNRDGSIGSKLRSLLKPPAMTFGYTAGNKSITEALAKDIYTDLSAKYVKLIQNKETLDSLTEAVNKANQAIAEAKTNAELKIAEDALDAASENLSVFNVFQFIEKNLLTEFTVKQDDNETRHKDIYTALMNRESSFIKLKYQSSKADINKHSLEALFNDILIPTYGNAVWKSLEASFAETIKYNENINVMFNTMFTIFDKEYTKGLKLLKEKHPEGIPIKAHDDLVKSLFNVLPMIRLAYASSIAKEVDNEIILEGALVIGKEKQTDNDKDSPTRTFTKSYFPNPKNRNEILSHTTQVKVLKFINAGKAGAVLPIHFLDGMAMTMILNKYGNEVVPVHDATVMSALRGRTITKDYNKLLYTLCTNYDLFDVIATRFKEVVQYYEKIDPSIKDNLVTSLNNSDLRTIRQLLAEVSTFNRMNQAARAEFKKDRPYMTNMDGQEASGYQVDGSESLEQHLLESEEVQNILPEEFKTKVLPKVNDEVTIVFNIDGKEVKTIAKIDSISESWSGPVDETTGEVSRTEGYLSYSVELTSIKSNKKYSFMVGSNGDVEQALGQNNKLYIGGKTFIEEFKSNPNRLNFSQVTELLNKANTSKEARADVVHKLQQLAKDTDNKVESTERINYLIDLLNSMDTTALDNLSVSIAESTANIGVVQFVDTDPNTVATNPESNVVIGIDNKTDTNLDPITRLSPLSGQSPVEIYVHEMIHAGIRFGLKMKNSISGMNKIINQVRTIHEKASEVITEDDFMPDTYDPSLKQFYRDNAKELWQYIFANPDSANNTGLQEFITFGLTNEKVMNKLKDTQLIEQKNPMKLLDRLIKLGKAILDVAFGRGKFQDVFSVAYEVLKGNISLRQKQNLYEQLVVLHTSINQANRRTVSKFKYSPKALFDLLFTTIGKLQTLGNNYVVPFTKYIFDVEGYPPHWKRPFIAQWKRTLTTSKWDSAKIFTQLILKYAFNANARKGLRIWLSDVLQLSQQGVAMSLLRDVTEPDAQSSRLEYINLLTRYTDTASKALETSVRNDIEQAFDTTLDDIQRRAITASVLKTDLHVLFDGSNIDEVKELLSSPSKRKARIKTLKDILRKEKTGNWLIGQTTALADFMVTGVGNEALNLNATNIAKGFLSGVVNFNPTEELIQTIDELATLLAIEYSGNKTNQVVASLNSNGLSNLLKIHKQFVKETKEGQVLNGNLIKTIDDIHTIKGYTKQLLDSSLDVKIDFIDRKAELKKASYELVEILSNNKITNAPTMALYIRKFAPPKRRDGAGFILNGLNSIGTSLRDSADQLMKYLDPLSTYKDSYTTYRAWVKKADTIRNEITAEMHSKELTREEIRKLSYGYTPIPNNSGVADYRITMSNATKEKHLNPDLDGVTVLSKMYANAHTKAQAKTRNGVLLGFLEADMHNNMGSNKRSSNGFKYIRLIPNSDNKFLRDSWHVIPQEIKDRIREYDKKYGGFWVRDDWLLSLLGVPSVSIADNKLVSSITGAGAKRVIGISEYVLKTVANITKRNIIMLVFKVLWGNVLSNLGYSVMNHMNPVAVIKKTARSGVNLRDYMDNKKVLNALEFKKRIGTATEAELNRIPRYVARLENNPLHGLMQKGLYQSIVEDIDIKELENTSKIIQILQNTKVYKKIPNIVKEGMRHLFMMEGTPIYDFMFTATQYSDFLSRAAEYELQMEKAPKKYEVIVDKTTNTKKKVVTQEYLRYEENVSFNILKAFINYDKPSSSKMQYLNDMGLLMFTKFATRIQSVITKGLIENPVGVLFFLLGQNFLVDTENILDQNVMDKHWLSLIQNPAENLVYAGIPMPLQHYLGIKQMF